MITYKYSSKLKFMLIARVHCICHMYFCPAAFGRTDLQYPEGQRSQEYQCLSSKKNSAGHAEEAGK